MRTHDPTSDDLALQARTELVLQLGTTMQRAGAPTHRVELALEAVACRLGIEAPSLYATPTALFFDDGVTTHLRRVRAEILDIGRLAELDELVESVIEPDEPLTAEAAVETLRAGLDDIESRREGCPRWLAIAMAVCVPPPFVLLLGGGFLEALVAAIIGLVIGELALIMQRTRSAPATELVAAAIAAALAGAAVSMVETLSGFRIVLAGIITFLPGFTLTLGMTELTSRHLVSGSARLTGAFSVLFQLVFGVALGASLVGADILDSPAVAASPPPLWAEVLLLAMLAVSLSVMFGARAREIGWITLTAGAAWASARLGGHFLAPGLAGFTGALGMGIVANIVSAWRRNPTVVLLVPGMMVLVPGSVGFRSFAALLGNDVASGVQGAFAMGLAAAGIAAGIFVAGALIDPRRHLRRAAAPERRRRRPGLPWLRA